MPGIEYGVGVWNWIWVFIIFIFGAFLGLESQSKGLIHESTKQFSIIKI